MAIWWAAGPCAALRRRCASACRTTDTAARYGGDEFVAILSDTDQEGAKLVVRRIAERLAEDADRPRFR